MKYNTRDNRIKPKNEINSGKRIVERAGYVSKTVRINKIMEAGQRLLEIRKEMYDYPNGTEVPDDPPIDPTRSKNFDLSDATIISRQIQQRNIERAEERKEKEKAKAIALAEQNKAQVETPEASEKGLGK